MPLPGVKTQSVPDPGHRAPFRTSWFQQEGDGTAIIKEGVIVDVNLALWTVDVISKFDQRFFPNVQISSPYMHSNRGEGIYICPDLGAKCHICIPSDGWPPFVLDFIMPVETIPQSGADDAPQGTDASHGGETQETGTASFAGGRVRPKPGDIYIKNRDGSFVVLHRGGVLQIGATELAQRLYIPLQNLVTDVSQNYRHHNTGGSINWFLNYGESENNPSTVWRHTYRLRANDEKASLRVAFGRLKDVVPELNSEASSDILGLGIGEEPTVCEVVLAPDGFAAESGDLQNDTANKTVLRYFFDKAGNIVATTKGAIYVKSEKTLRVRLGDDLVVAGGGNFNLEFKGTGRLQAGTSLDIGAGVVKINGGGNPVAHVGSQVEMIVTTPIPITVEVLVQVSPPPAPPVPGIGTGAIVTGSIFTGSVVTGNPSILV